MSTLWKQILPVRRHLNIEGGFAVNGSLEEGTNKVDLFNSASKLGSLSEKHANGTKRGSRRPGVFHHGLTLEITMNNDSTFELVKGAIRLDLAMKSFHEGSDWMVDDLGGVDNGEVKNFGVN